MQVHLPYLQVAPDPRDKPLAQWLGGAGVALKSGLSEHCCNSFSGEQSYLI